MPISATVVAVRVLRGVESPRVLISAEGDPVTVSVTFADGIDYSAWTAYAEAKSLTTGDTIGIPPVESTNQQGRQVVEIEIDPAEFYGLTINGDTFDNPYLLYPRTFKLTGWFENASETAADVFVSGVVSLTTAQPASINSTVIE